MAPSLLALVVGAEDGVFLGDEIDRPLPPVGRFGWYKMCCFSIGKPDAVVVGKACWAEGTSVFPNVAAMDMDCPCTSGAAPPALIPDAGIGMDVPNRGFGGSVDGSSCLGG